MHERTWSKRLAREVGGKNEAGTPREKGVARRREHNPSNPAADICPGPRGHTLAGWSLWTPSTRSWRSSRATAASPPRGAES